MSSIDIFTSAADLAGLARDWRDLAQSAPCTVYQTHGWSLACSRFLSAAATLRVLAVRDQGGRLTGLAPFYVSRRFGIRHLRLLGGAVFSRQQMIIARPGAESEVADALAEFLIRDDDWDVLDLRDVPEWAEAAHRLSATLAARGCERRTTERREHRVIPLGATFDGYFGSLPAGLRRELNRETRRLREAGAVERPVREPHERVEALDTLFAQHRHRFTASGRQSAVTPRWVAFYRVVLEELQDEVVLSVMETQRGAAPLAVDLSLVHGDHWHDRVASFDLTSPLRRFGPLNILKLYLIRQAVERGCREFDLSFGQEPYKQRLGAVPRTLLSMQVVAPRRRARVASAAWDLGQLLVRSRRRAR